METLTATAAPKPDAPTVVVTGASDGIGARAAALLYARGANVVVVGRSPSKTRAVAERLGVPYHTADFANLDEVRRLADELLAYPRIDVLANNAGLVLDRLELREGAELTMVINHLAPFLLTRLLLPRLLEAKGVVINTSSVANWIFARPQPDELLLPGKFAPMKAYGNSKLANILFAQELHRRHGTELRTAAFHPGFIRSNFAGDAKVSARLLYQTPLGKVALSSVDEGAAPIVRFALKSDWESGQYYAGRGLGHVHRFAKDPAHAARLWEVSSQYVGLGN